MNEILQYLPELLLKTKTIYDERKSVKKERTTASQRNFNSSTRSLSNNRINAKGFQDDSFSSQPFKDAGDDCEIFIETAIEDLQPQITNKNQPQQISNRNSELVRHLLNNRTLVALKKTRKKKKQLKNTLQRAH